MVNSVRRTEERGYLTERQLEILTLRKQGLNQRDTALRLGITRQDVAILEKRALRNIGRAAATLEIAVELGVVTHLSLQAGIHILDAAKRILERADTGGIRLSDNAVTILSGIRSASGSAMRNGVLEAGLEAYILPDGRLFFRERGTK